MFYADTLGVGKVVDKLKALKASTGDACWQPDSLLLELAQSQLTLGSLN